MLDSLKASPSKSVVSVLINFTLLQLNRLVYQEGFIV